MLKRILLASVVQFAPLLAAPSVTNVWFAQRQNSNLVDVWYDLSTGSVSSVTVSLQFSTDGGTSWTIAPRTVTGDIGLNQKAGTRKHIVWDAGQDCTSLSGERNMAKVIADDGVSPPPVRVPPTLRTVPHLGDVLDTRSVFDTIVVEGETLLAVLSQQRRVTSRPVFAGSPSGKNTWTWNEEVTLRGYIDLGYYTVRKQGVYRIVLNSANDKPVLVRAATGGTVRVPSQEGETLAEWSVSRPLDSEDGAKYVLVKYRHEVSNVPNTLFFFKENTAFLTWREGVDIYGSLDLGPVSVWVGD